MSTLLIYHSEAKAVPFILNMQCKGTGMKRSMGILPSAGNSSDTNCFKYMYETMKSVILQLKYMYLSVALFVHPLTNIIHVNLSKHHNIYMCV